MIGPQMHRGAAGSREAGHVFGGLARFGYRRPGLIVALALLLVAGSAIAARDVFDVVKPFAFQDPDSESSRATELYESATGTQPPPGVVALVEVPSGADSSAGRSRVEEVAEALSSVPGIATTDAADGRSGLVSKEGRAALVVGSLIRDVNDPAEVGEAAEQRLVRFDGVLLGGPAVAAHQINEQSEADVRRIELVVAPILLIICLWVFRGVVAATLPLIIGAFSILVSIALLRMIAELVEIDVFSITIVTGLGLGLAIDYNLLIVSRYREEIARGGRGREAIERTLRTAGSTVAFSAITVAVALAALLIFPQRFLYSAGIGGAMVALVSAAAALTILPALLALLGTKINALAPPRLQRRAAVGATSTEHEAGGTWYRLARFAVGRPALVTVVAVGALLAATLPVLGIDLTTADARVLPQERSAHQVEAAVSRRFASGATTPLVAVSTVPEDDGALRTAPARLRGQAGVARVRGPVALDDRTQALGVFSRADPLSDEGQELLRRIRGLDWPAPVLVTGRSAELADQISSLEGHLLPAVALIVSLTLLALFALTRSVVLPVAALAMNLLTIGASLGIVVFIFQDGRLEGLLDYSARGAIDISMPVLIIAVAFGVSTDYGVFLLGRIRELRDAGQRPRDAVVLGLGRTGRVITAAALLFAVAIGAFAGSELVMIKQGAIGIAAAVLIDATIVRGLLLPGLLRLLGERAWWAPAPLARRTGS